jgi:L-malate glycosyltransferase
MNVMHVDTERGWRGGERQVLWLATELHRRGVATTIVGRPDEPLAQRARAAGLTTIGCTPLFEADPMAAWRLRRAISAHGVDIVHAHTAHAAGLAALAVAGTSTKLVIARRVDFRLRDNAFTRWKYSKASRIVAVSRAVAQALEASGIDAGAITVVADGTDTSRVIPPASVEVLRALGVAASAPLVVQVAQLVAHKDPLNFVRAVAEARRDVPGLQALLVGDGALRADAEREVDALGLRGTLHLTGYRTDADSLLASADVCVLSSREEGMGSVLLDALLLGKPIAATRAGGIPEVVSDGQTALLAPVGDPRSLGAAIARLLKDKTLASRLAVAARARANEFSVQVMTDRTEAVYAALVEGAR